MSDKMPDAWIVPSASGDGYLCTLSYVNLPGWNRYVPAARIAELERENDALHAELDGTRAELAQAREERDKARLYCAEVASYICDPMYDKVENRAGIAADAEAMATGEMTGRYLDIKMQTERAIRAEAELAAERERREAAEAVIHTCQWAMRQPLDGWKGECERKALDEARAHFARYEKDGGPHD